MTYHSGNPRVFAGVFGETNCSSPERHKESDCQFWAKNIKVWCHLGRWFWEGFSGGVQVKLPVQNCVARPPMIGTSEGGLSRDHHYPATIGPGVATPGPNSIFQRTGREAKLRANGFFLACLPYRRIARRIARAKNRLHEMGKGWN